MQLYCTLSKRKLIAEQREKGEKDEVASRRLSQSSAGSAASSWSKYSKQNNRSVWGSAGANTLSLEEECVTDGEWSEDSEEEEAPDSDGESKSADDDDDDDDAGYDQWIVQVEDNEEEEPRKNRSRGMTEDNLMDDPILLGLLKGHGFENVHQTGPFRERGMSDASKVSKFSATTSAQEEDALFYEQKASIKKFIKKNKGNLMLYLFERSKTIAVVNDIVDQYLLTATSLISCVALTEVLMLKKEYAEFMTAGSQIASDFVRSCLPLLEELLQFNPSIMKKNIAELSTVGIWKDMFNSNLKGAVKKIQILDAIFITFDNYVFPRSMDSHTSGVKCLAVSHMDGQIILSGGYDRLLRIVNVSSREVLGVFAGHKSIITSCKFSSKDTFFISSSFDTTIRIWNSQTAQCKYILYGHTDSVMCADLSPDDTLIVSGAMDSTVRLWNCRDGKCLRIFRGHSPPSWIKSAKFSSEGKYIISSGLDKRVCVWCVRPLLVEANKQKPVELWTAHDDYILDSATAAPDLLATTSKDGKVNFWNVTTGALRKSVSTKLPTWCNIVSVSEDGKLTLAASFDNFILVYRTNQGVLLRQIRIHNAGILSAIFSLDGTQILVGTIDGKIQAIDV
jgi:WD40 repeat protein